MRKSYYEIKKFARKRTDEAKTELKKQYIELVKGAKQTVKATIEMIKEVKARTKKEGLIIKKKLNKYIKEIEELAKKYQKVIEQTTRRVVNEEIVPMEDKLISYVSNSASIISKGKENKSREVGQKLSITEVENGVISNWEVYEGNPNDATLLETSLKNCGEAIGKIPKNNSFDRGYWSKKGIELLEKTLKINLHIPKRGKKSQADKKRESTWAFKTYQKFRSGGEGRISVLKRRAGLRTLKVRGGKSTKIKIGWAILADNLRIVA